jgi:hypothetical protein
MLARPDKVSRQGFVQHVPGYAGPVIVMYFTVAQDRIAR